MRFACRHVTLPHRVLVSVVRPSDTASCPALKPQLTYCLHQHVPDSMVLPLVHKVQVEERFEFLWPRAESSCSHNQVTLAAVLCQVHSQLPLLGTPTQARWQMRGIKEEISSVQWLVVLSSTIVAWKNAHGQSTLQSCQRRGWGWGPRKSAHFMFTVTNAPKQIIWSISQDYSNVILGKVKDTSVLCSLVPRLCMRTWEWGFVSWCVDGLTATVVIFEQSYKINFSS